MLVLKVLSEESDSKWVAGIVFVFDQISNITPPPHESISFSFFTHSLSPLEGSSLVLPSL